MAKDQLESDINKAGFSWFGSDGAVVKEKLYAKIYFATNKSNLTKDDKDVIDLLIEHVGRIISRKWDIKITYKGHADIRGPVDDNITLSQGRIDEVIWYFNRQLRFHRIPSDSVVRYLPFVKPYEKSFGEKFARKARKFWAQDRRVDIFVRVFPKQLAKMYEEEWECIKRDVWFFSGYCPEAKLWQKYQLEYLIARWFYVFNRIRQIKIKPWDLEKVKKLLKELMDSGEYKRFEIDLKSCSTEEKKELIETTYYYVFFRIWNKIRLKYKEVWKKQKTPYQCGGNGRVTQVAEY